MNRRRLTLVMLALVAMGGAIGGWWFSQSVPLLHPEEGRSVAHAAPGQVEGCTVCHQAAIPYENCLDCHSTPSTTVGNNVYLRHHEIADGCDVCHAGIDNDARFVVVPTSGHSFCQTCHSQMGHDQS